MTAEAPAPAPTRAPATHANMLAEQGMIAALGVVLFYGLGTQGVEFPANVQAAVLLLLAFGWQHAASYFRTERATGKTTAVSLVMLVGFPLPFFHGPGANRRPWVLAGAFALMLFAVSCVTYNGDALTRAAGSEIVALRGTAPEAPIDVARCDALSSAAGDLRDEDGGTRSANLPFMAGQHVEKSASSFERLAALCFELARRDGERGVDSALRARNRAAWVKAWQNGRELLGGDLQPAPL